MSKICILSTVNLKHMTLISLYTEYMDKNNISYDIIYIDKYHEVEQNNADEVYKFDLYIDRNWSLPRKFLHYWKFKKYASELLINNQYDFIITWNVFTAYMFSDVLKKYYKDKYCLNIRDIGSKKNIIMNNGLRKALRNTAFATISSDGFKKYLPSYNYTTIHSLNKKILNECVPHTKLKNKDEPIIITYIGYMCFYENCYKLIDELGNDSRFILNFFGQGSNLIEEYAKTKGINNVFCIGKFEPMETSSLIQDADIIYNLYGVGDINLDTALSIKLYYAVYLNVPILVFKNTYMEEISRNCGISYSIEKDGFSEIGDRLYDWYHNQNQEIISKKCDLFIEDIELSHKNLEKLMSKFLKSVRYS